MLCLAVFLMLFLWHILWQTLHPVLLSLVIPWFRNFAYHSSHYFSKSSCAEVVNSSNMDESLYDSISSFLQSSKDLRTWPSGIKTKNEKRNFRQKCDKFTVQDDTLHYKHPHLGLLRAIKVSEKMAILTACHSSLGDGGHLGIDKSRKKANSRFYWPRINEDMKEFIGKYSHYIDMLYYVWSKHGAGWWCHCYSLLWTEC